MKDIGDRMKSYEIRQRTKLLTRIPYVVRVDGKSFHTFTKDLKTPYDERFIELMNLAMKFTAFEMTGVTAAYRQSDEISFVFYEPDYEKTHWLGGRVQKLASVVASLVSVNFNKHMHRYLPDKMSETPVFDGRAFQLPDRTEACNYLVWRALDAKRNSINMLARSHYSQSKLNGVSQDELLEMIKKKGRPWKDHPEQFTQGTYMIQNEDQTLELVKRFPSIMDIENREDIFVPHNLETDDDN